MKKTLLTFLLLLTTVAIPLWAATKTADIGSIRYSIDETTLTAILDKKIGNGKNPQLVIPEKIISDGIEYTVTVINKFAFFRDSSIVSVIIPQSVIEIRDNAFSGCPNIKDVYFSEGLQHLGKDVFYNSTRIKKVSFPSTLISVGNNAFGYKHIETLIIRNPNTIYDYSFISSCSNPSKIYSYSKVPPLNLVNYNSYKFTLFVPKGCKDVYAATEPFSTSATSIIEFGAEQAELRIAQGDYGSVVMNVDKDVQHTIKLECGEGWKIARVMFNETDMTDNLDADNSFTTPEITDDSNLLSVTYEESLAGVETVTDDTNVSVTARHGLITVSGATAGTRINVYDLSGALQSPAITATGSGSEMIETAPGAVRIVRVGSRTFKVMP